MKTLPFIAILVSMFLTPDSLAQKLNQVVLDAYEIRMNGNADEAADMLKKYIEKDSSNAMVYFEYARALCHLSPVLLEFNRTERKLINNTDTIKRDEALAMVEKAIELDFWNQYFHFLRGNIHTGNSSREKNIYRNDNLSAQTDQLFLVIESNFNSKPDINLALGLHTKYLIDGLRDSAEMQPQKIEKYRNFIKENDSYEYVKLVKRESVVNRKLSNLDYFSQFLKTDSLNVDLLKELGNLCLYADSVTQGIKYYENALRISGDYQDVLGFLWLNPIAESKSLRHNLNVESKETLDEWKVEKIMAFLETNPNAPSKCLSYMSLSNIYKRWGENEKAQEMELMARKTEPYFYKLGHYDEALLRNPLEVFEYCNLRENLSE
ncbi:hypothetical protein [Maribellus sediminis]|uniref:hypothetical protein n=1 Tax=Maribellus sediminis TaxID=2696285 RepID=UPI0014314615|nr:hypothetical protein [Maribellus sediminis]